MKQRFATHAMVAIACVLMAGCSAPSGGVNEPSPNAAPGMTPRAFIPSFSGNPSGDQACANQHPIVTIAPNEFLVEVGETITVTVVVANEGCDDLGLPQYRLWTEPRDAASRFEPAQIEPVVHSLAVTRHQSDSADFALRAVTAGEQAFGASVSYELHTEKGATWGLTSAPLITITVTAP